MGSLLSPVSSSSSSSPRGRGEITKQCISTNHDEEGGGRAKQHAVCLAVLSSSCSPIPHPNLRILTAVCHITYKLPHSCFLLLQEIAIEYRLDAPRREQALAFCLLPIACIQQRASSSSKPWNPINCKDIQRSSLF